MNSKTKNREGVSDLNTDPKDTKSRLTDFNREKAYALGKVLFSTQQFIFVKGHSTALQLLNVIDSWTKALDRGECIAVVYLDFMKAFDTIPHKRMIGELKSYGIEYYTLR